MKHYAVSDLHGRYDIWTHMKEILQPEDYLYCLGDNIDRGPKGMHIFEEMLKRPNTTILMGNHEKMCAQEYDEDRPPVYSLWFSNGGDKTYKEMGTMGWDHVRTLVQFMKKLPYIAKYTNSNGTLIVLHHAGFHPDWSGTNIRYRMRDQEEDLWNRKHFIYNWPSKEDECWTWPGVKELKDAIIVHGHTPVQALTYFGARLPEVDTTFMDDNPNVKPCMVTYCGGHKIDIDMASAQTGWGCLLDLDTLKPKYISADGDITD